MTQRIGPYDAMLAPAVPIVAPRVEDIDSDAAFTRYNVWRCATPAWAISSTAALFSIPVHQPGDAPVGLMIGAANGLDQALIRRASRRS